MSNKEPMVVVSEHLPNIVYHLLQEFKQGNPDMLLIVYTDPRLQWTTNVRDQRETAKILHALLGRWQRGDAKIEVEPDSLAGEVAQKLPVMVEAVAELLTDLVGESVPFSLLVRSEIGVQYAAKARRDDVVKLLRELADSLQMGYIGTPAHRVTFQ